MPVFNQIRASAQLLRSLLTSCLLALAQLAAHAQLQASQWYFGQQAGLDFRPAVPAALTNGQLTAMEGCSSRADSLGNLLFYTNGGTVWNRQHQVMAGAAGAPSKPSYCPVGPALPTCKRRASNWPKTSTTTTIPNACTPRWVTVRPSKLNCTTALTYLSSVSI